MTERLPTHQEEPLDHLALEKENVKNVIAPILLDPTHPQHQEVLDSIIEDVLSIGQQEKLQTSWPKKLNFVGKERNTKGSKLQRANLINNGETSLDILED